jgi:hypothetical protein
MVGLFGSYNCNGKTSKSACRRNILALGYRFGRANVTNASWSVVFRIIIEELSGEATRDATQVATLKDLIKMRRLTGLEALMCSGDVAFRP